MNLFLYFICTVFGLSRFVFAVCFSLVLSIIGDFIVIFLGKAHSVIVRAIIRIIALVVFIKIGFPIRGVLWFFAISDAISILAIIIDSKAGVKNILKFIIDIIGMILFRVNLLKKNRG